MCEVFGGELALEVEGLKAAASGQTDRDLHRQGCPQSGVRSVRVMPTAQC